MKNNLPRINSTWKYTASVSALRRTNGLVRVTGAREDNGRYEDVVVTFIYLKNGKPGNEAYLHIKAFLRIFQRVRESGV